MSTNLYSARQFLKECDALILYLNKLNPELASNNFEKISIRVKDSIDKMHFYQHDMFLSHEFNGAINDAGSVLNLIKEQLTTATTVESLKSLTTILSLIRKDEIDKIRTWNLIGEADDYYYDNNIITQIDCKYLNHIRNSMNSTNLNIFHVNCKNGMTLKNFKVESNGDKTFGNSTNSFVKDNVDRVIKGDLKGAHISNNYFDVVIVTPCVSYAHETNSFGQITEPKEKTVVKNSIKYLRPNGVYMIKIPASRIDAGLALWLSKALSDNTQVVRISESNLEMVLIIGQKNITQKPKEALYDKLKYLDYDKDTIDISEFNTIFEIPTEQLTLEFFRGSTLDVEDVLEATDTNLINDFLDSQTQPLVVKDQSPLLPFNIGQIGLVLTSGCLDGVVEEIDGVYHVIKGMTTKLSETRTDIDEANESVKATETVKNQVKINVFTADGQFISLS